MPQKKLGGFKKNVRKSDTEKKGETTSSTCLKSQADHETCNELISACNLLVDCGEIGVYDFSALDVTKLEERAGQLAAKFNTLLEDSDEEKTMPERALIATGKSKIIRTKMQEQDKNSASLFKVPESRPKMNPAATSEDEEIQFKWKKNKEPDTKSDLEEISEKKKPKELGLIEESKDKILNALLLGRDDNERKPISKLQEVSSTRQGLHHDNTQAEENEEDDDIF